MFNCKISLIISFANGRRNDRLDFPRRRRRRALLFDGRSRARTIARETDNTVLCVDVWRPSSVNNNRPQMTSVVLRRSGLTKTDVDVYLLYGGTVFNSPRRLARLRVCAGNPGDPTRKPSSTADPASDPPGHNSYIISTVTLPNFACTWIYTILFIQGVRDQSIIYIQVPPVKCVRYSVNNRRNIVGLR